MYSRLLTNNKGERSGQAFRPVADYANPPQWDYQRDYRPEDDWYRIELGPDLKVHRDVFVDVICAEYSLRATVQRVDMVKKIVQALEKAASIENNKTQLADWEAELEQLQRRCWQKELDLYEYEQMIPEWPLKHNYDLLRQSGAWYMRKELVRDCVDRGGCCSRSCGCCGRRHLDSERKKGVGYCTVECSCCSTYRDVELSVVEKAKITGRLRDNLRNQNPSFLLRMAEAYFLGPGPADYSTSKPGSWWTWLCECIHWS
jgi:hypothetical protein